MKCKDIYLVFSYTGSNLSNFIKLVTSDNYTHVSLSLDDTFTEMYSFGRKVPTNPFIAGLVKENLYDGTFKLFNKSKCLIYKVKITENQFISLKKDLDNHFSKKDIYRYNFLGLLLVNFKFPYKRSNYYFCSQFVAELLINNEIFSSEKKPEFIKPSDIQSIGHDDILYEGLVTNFSV
ncbi:MAG: hypothetical protein RSD13_01135 [Clostridium sp.]|uniref:hypothetical protein n=1 Tax=Clostridium sp. TaxID=1506 RepID=UPI002FC75EF2